MKKIFLLLLILFLVGCSKEVIEKPKKKEEVKKEVEAKEEVATNE